MMVERFEARVTNDVHRDTAGAVVTDGCVEVVVPGYGGENKLKWIPPSTRGVHVVPPIGANVTLLVADNQLRWEPLGAEVDFPAWMQENYPQRSGLHSRNGVLQFAFDE